MSTLFSLPISSTSGFVVCTKPIAHKEQEQRNIYVLTITSPKDNRLTPTLIDALLLSLDIIEHRYPKGVVVTTSGITKFYSNGLDLAIAINTEGFLEIWMWPLFRRFLTWVSLLLLKYRTIKANTTIQIPYADCMLFEWSRFCGWIHTSYVPRLPGPISRTRVLVSQRARVWRAAPNPYDANFS
jgi:hypothetical protein